jgi:uncharacterized membrane protein YoaK (UPF0700 family)
MATKVKPTLPSLLSFNGGYVDTAGYLALQGLFTAHVTGNFVTIGAALVFGTTGVLAKLLALPVFCAVIIVTRIASFNLPGRNWLVLETMLSLKLILLIVAAALAIRFGPFQNGDAWLAVLTGMTLVSAMAIQNAAHRIHLGTAPPSTLMTGTTTQIMIDIADVIRGLAPDKRDATWARLRHMSVAVASFACGAAGAALLLKQFGTWCFVVPPIVALWVRMTAGANRASPGANGSAAPAAPSR